MSTDQQIRLTTYSKGAGCGCKIAPGVLEEILKSSGTSFIDSNLLIGNNTNDDAAVYDIGNNQAIISTTDFFMPIVDDAFDFGRIASANAISDVYAMGGKPLMAIAILGWPIEKLSPSIAQQVLEGARKICSEAGIPLAGGHSIDSAEPIFGLSVTGIIDKENIKQNNTSQLGDYLFLTKPIGLGILSTALKREVIENEHLQEMMKHMTHLNSIGEQLGKIDGVTAMTDVTGFGLLGHCMEMAEGAGLSIELSYGKIPVVAGAREYLSKRIVPDATYRNWNNYNSKTSFEKGVNVMEAFSLLPDPQTNGGLLFSVSESYLDEVKNLMKTNGYEKFVEPVGVFTERKEKVITVGL
jgi:selenide,water dikinase